MPVLHIGDTFCFDYWSIVIMMTKEPWQLKMVPTKLIVLIKKDEMIKEYSGFSHRCGHSCHFRSVSSVGQREIVTISFWNFVHLRDAQARLLRALFWNFTKQFHFLQPKYRQISRTRFFFHQTGATCLLTLLWMPKAFTIIIYHVCNVSTSSHVILDQTYLLYHSDTNSSGGIQDKNWKDN